ncbi:hypothetical protein DH86_00002620 [Scytalidium sp. 3C]|nr:hypothetical protein DH86_00002620 [Scytalidium sp. 3C]
MPKRAKQAVSVMLTHYAVNFPLRDGIDDVTYKSIFEPVIQSVMDYYQPEAIVLQCGGDSLSGDRLGCFNLSMRGHANCVNFVKSFGMPTLVLGGGGYTMRNVARTWAYETGVLVGEQMDPVLPYNEYYEYYGPDYELDVRASNMDNANSKDYLEKIKTQVIENLKKTAHAPSVQLTEVPRTTILGGADEDDAELDDLDEDENKDKRTTKRRWDQRISRDDELDESDDEEESRANGVRAQNGVLKRRNIMDYQNPNAVASDVDMDSGLATPEVQNEADEEANAMVTAANAEVNAELMEKKALEANAAETETNAAQNEESAVPSVAAQVDNEGDVEMTEPAAEEEKPKEEAAPAEPAPPEAAPNAEAAPASPAPEQAATASDAVEVSAEPVAQDATEIKQEAEAERKEEDVAAEEATEDAVKQSPS